MAPEQRLKAAVLAVARDWDYPKGIPDDITAENVDAIYEEIDGDDYELQDARSELRGGTVKTGIQAPWSRHYESESVAAKMPDGTWIGWTYWFGGGKHGEPEGIDWMSEAYELDCAEEQKMVTVRTFTKREPPHTRTHDSASRRVEP